MKSSSSSSIVCVFASSMDKVVNRNWHRNREREREGRIGGKDRYVCRLNISVYFVQFKYWISRCRTVCARTSPVNLTWPTHKASSGRGQKNSKHTNSPKPNERIWTYKTWKETENKGNRKHRVFYVRKFMSATATAAAAAAKLIAAASNWNSFICFDKTSFCFFFFFFFFIIVSIYCWFEQFFSFLLLFQAISSTDEQNRKENEKTAGARLLAPPNDLANVTSAVRLLMSCLRERARARMCEWQVIKHTFY